MLVRVQRSTVDVLESIAVGSVAVTALALAQAGVELTFAQWRVLVVISDLADGATVGEIATRIGSAHSPASRLVARMRRHGLVATEQDTHDRRATRVRMTDHGRDVRERVVGRRRALLEEAVGANPLPPTVAQRLDALAGLLRGFE